MQHFYKQHAIIILLLCNCCLANSQQFSFDNYNKSNGLVNNEVHSIMQASNGFMYFGTPSGLSIFDGAAFTNFDLRRGFRGNMISCIQEMPGGQMLLFTQNNEFYRILDQHLTIDSFEKNIAVKNIYKTRSGSYYASTYSGLFDFINGRLVPVPVSTGKIVAGINCVIQWQDSLLVVGRSYEPVDIYNMHTWQRVASSTEKLFVRNFCADASGNIWISTIGSGVFLMKRGAVQQQHILFEKLPVLFAPFSTTEFRAAVSDKENNLWLGTINSGLIKYNPVTKELRHISMAQGLVSNTIFSLYCDVEDNIWIGTNRGIQKLANKNVLSYASAQGLPADLVLSALPLPNNRIITSGYSGVAYIPDFGGKITTWIPPLEDEHFSQFVSLNKAYFGLSVKKLVALNITETNISAKAVYPLPSHFFGITALHSTALLLGGDSSILLFKNGKLEQITKDSVHAVSCMVVDSAGDLWTGSFKNTINGYHLQQKNTSVFAEPKFHFSANSRGVGNYISCITTDKHNRILYGSSQTGITILVKKNNALVVSASIDVSAGLSTNDVFCLYWDNDSTLLAGTGYGLDKIVFSENGNSFYIHNINDYYNFSNSVYCIEKDAAGNFLLGTESGLIKIPAVDIEQHITNTPPVAISSIHLLSKPDSLLNFKNTIALPYNNSGITIYFASPAFTNEKNTRYVYRLLGGDQNNWSQPSYSNNVALLHLSPGHYNFIVKTVNIFGTPSKTEASVEIIIRPPFWQKWWFYFLAAVIISALLFFMIRRRIRNIRKESALKNKITEAEMMALRAQMNPHFIFNCMNSIDGLITSNRNEEAQDFLQKFSKLIRLVLENSQYQQVPLQQDLQALELYVALEAIRSNNRFTYSFNVDKILLENDYKIPPLLLQPYVENAIVHGLRNKETSGGKLLVSIKKDNDQIRITIEDNGIGRAAAALLNEANKKPHQQLGMKVTGKRIDLLQLANRNQLVFFIEDMDNGAETGTRVTIILPGELKF